MASVMPATQVSIADLESRFNLQEATEANFFPEWSTDLEALTELEQRNPLSELGLPFCLLSAAFWY